MCGIIPLFEFDFLRFAARCRYFPLFPLVRLTCQGRSRICSELCFLCAPDFREARAPLGAALRTEGLNFRNLFGYDTLRFLSARLSRALPSPVAVLVLVEEATPSSYMDAYPVRRRCVSTSVRGPHAEREREVGAALQALSVMMIMM